MPQYKAIAGGFWKDAQRKNAGDIVTTDKELDPVPSWLEPFDPSEPVREIADIRATDAAIELAQANLIDITEIDGSGADGNVTKGDVQRAIVERNQAPVAEGMEDQPGTPQEKFKSASDVEVI